MTSAVVCNSCSLPADRHVEKTPTIALTPTIFKYNICPAYRIFITFCFRLRHEKSKYAMNLCEATDNEYQ